MSFWKFMISFFVVSTIADLTYLQHDFFQYKLFFTNDFQWSSPFKFIIEILIFAVLLYGVYNLLELLDKWWRERKYIKAQKELNED